MLGIPTDAGANWGFPAGWALGRFRLSAVGGLNCSGNGVECFNTVDSVDGDGFASWRGGGSGRFGVGRVTEGG